MNETIIKQIDACFCNDSHYDISLVSFEIFKDKFKYTGCNKWYYLTENNKWLIDNKQMKLKNYINTIVCNAFVERALYWEFKKNSDNNQNQSYLQEQLIAEKLLQISYKLKNYNFVLLIIKESKQFFEI